MATTPEPVEDINVEADPVIGPDDSDGNTSTRPPEVQGGQPAVGDDRPRNTEF